MQTTNNGYVVTTPDYFIPVFNPSIFKVEGVESSATLEITSEGTSFIDIRQAMGGVVEWDIAPYLHALYANFHINKIREKIITVKILADGMVSFIHNSEYMVLRAYSSPLMPFGHPVRQVYYRALRDNINQIFTLVTNGKSMVATDNDDYNGEFLTPFVGYKDFSLKSIFNDHEAIAVTVYKEDGNDAIYSFRTDDSTCGVMLKWLDAQGYYRYYLMQAGESTTTTKDSGELIPMMFNAPRTIFYDEESVTAQVGIPQGVSVEQSQKLCATFSDEEDRELLDTIFFAPLVWVVNTNNGKETPVTIKRGSRSTANGLQDYEIEIKYPAPQTMML